MDGDDANLQWRSLTGLDSSGPPLPPLLLLPLTGSSMRRRMTSVSDAYAAMAHKMPTMMASHGAMYAQPAVMPTRP